ncbi:MAG TPA: acyl-CoA dehydrogenase family protein, partial [Polyangia bacterium]|nr:acyl-CoA dehydrogenase family protein [Polyangia bacterium]
MGNPSITLSPGGGFLLEPTGSASIFTPEMLDDEQRMMKKTADDFMKGEVLPRLADIEAKKPGLMRELMEKAGALGLLGHDVPEAYGGLDGDKSSSSLIAESVAMQGSFAVSFGAHVGIGTMPIVLFGTPSQRQKYLPGLASGEKIAAYALTEPGSGSDALAAKTKAVLSADGKSWKLTGSKLYITNAGFADIFTIFAKVDGEKFTAFLVDRNAPGLTVGPEEHKLGIRGSSTCPLYLEDCTIPVDSVLGEIGKGHKIAFNILNIGRFKLAAACVGGARHSLQEAIGYAKERKAFGKTIADFGLIQEKLAESAAGIYAGEAMIYRTIGMIDAALADVDTAAAGASR